MPYYRTRDGWAIFAFSIEPEGSGYRAYIEGWADGRVSPSQVAGDLAGIDYGSRDDGPHATHRLTAGDGRKYICWDGPLRTPEQARQVCALWAENTAEYIRTGRRF